ncbi:MAG: hypothetical protein R6V85_00135 [Polyangia bacterium]
MEIACRREPGFGEPRCSLGRAGLSSAAVFFLSFLLALFSGCGRQQRRVDPGSDTDDGGVDTGTETGGGASLAHGWGDAPGYRMAWAVGAGGSTPDRYGDGFWATALFPCGDVGVGGSMKSDQYVFGAGTQNEIWLDGAEDGMLFVARYSHAGVPLWVSPIKGIDFGISELEAPGDGSLVAWGETTNGSEPIVFGAGGPGEMSFFTGGPWANCFLVRYLEDGTPDWVTHSTGMPCIAREDGLSIAPDGDFCACGGYGEFDPQDPPLEFDDGSGEPFVVPKTGDGHPQGFLARFDSEGGVEWAYSVKDDSGFADTWSALAMPDGSCVFTGYYGNSGVSFQDGSGGEESLSLLPWAGWGQFVVKYDEPGDLDWIRDLGVAGHQDGIALGGNAIVSVEAEGDIFVSGVFNGEIIAGTESDPFYQSAGGDKNDHGIYLARLDGQSGERVFTGLALEESSDETGSFDMEPVDFVGDLAVLPAGGIVQGGSFSGKKTFGALEDNETELVTTGPGSDAFLAVYEPDDGSLRWAFRVAFGSEIPPYWPECGEIVQSLSVNDSGSIFAGGAFLGEATFGTGQNDVTFLSSLGAYDAFLLRLDPVAIFDPR